MKLSIAHLRILSTSRCCKTAKKWSQSGFVTAIRDWLAMEGPGPNPQSKSLLMMDRTQCTSCDNMPWLVVNSMAPPAPQAMPQLVLVNALGVRTAAGALPNAGSSGLKSATKEVGTESELKL